MHAMATHHRGTECPLNRDIDLNRENPETTDTEIESTHDFDPMVALTKPEEAGHPKDPEYNNHAKLMTLTREIDDICQ